MREEEFRDKLENIYCNEEITQPIYWYIDFKGDVVVDYEEMMREFECKLQEIGEIENG